MRRQPKNQTPRQAKATNRTERSNDTKPELEPMNRRRFIRVFAASGAALVATGLAGRTEDATAAVAPPKAAAPKPRKPLPPRIAKEIRAQEKSLADILKVLRAYELAAGSEPATVFRPMRASRRGR